MKIILYALLLFLTVASCSTATRIERIKETMTPVPVHSFEELQTGATDANLYVIPFVPFFTRMDVADRQEMYSFGYEFGRIQNHGLNFQQSTLIQGVNKGRAKMDNQGFKNSAAIPRLDLSISASYPMIKFKRVHSVEKPIVFHSTISGNVTTSHFIIPEIEFNRSIRVRVGIDYDFQEKISHELYGEFNSIRYDQKNLALSFGLSFWQFFNYRYLVIDQDLQSFRGRRSTSQEFYADVKWGLSGRTVPIEREYFNYSQNTTMIQRINPSDSLLYSNIGFEVGYRLQIGLGKKVVGMFSASYGLAPGFGDSFSNNSYLLIKYSFGFVQYNNKLIGKEG